MNIDWAMIASGAGVAAGASSVIALSIKGVKKVKLLLQLRKAVYAFGLIIMRAMAALKDDQITQEEREDIADLIGKAAAEWTDVIRMVRKLFEK